MRLGDPFVMVHMVPFVSLGSNDHKKMIRYPYFNMSSCGGRLESVIDFRTSVEK